MFKWNYDSPRRGASHRGRPFREFDACLGGWDVPGEPYTVAEGSEFKWLREPDAGRPHEPLGPRQPALRPPRLQGSESRRPGRRLAHLLRGRRALLRQRRPDGRDLRQPRGPAERAGRQVPAAARGRAARAAGQEGLRRARGHLHPLAHVDPHAPARRSRRLPLLRAVRPRMHDLLELLLAHGAPAAALETGRLEPRSRGPWPRGTTDNEGRCHRRLLRRHRHGRERQVRAKVVVLAACACESARHAAELARPSASRRPRQWRAGRSDATSPTPRARAWPPTFPPSWTASRHNEDGTGEHAHLHAVVG